MGRKYYRRDSSWYTMEDVSINVFVPENYPFDTAKPKELTLRCSVEATGPYQKEILVGNVKLDSWQENTIWPLNRIKKDELEMILQQAWTKTGDQDKCHKILELVQQLDTSNKYVHQIEKIKLRMFIKEKNYNDAALLTEKLLPVEFEVFKNAKANANYYEFYDYIIAIAGNGDVQKSTELFNQLKQLKPDLSKYNNNAKKHIKERLARQITDGYRIKMLMQSLFAAGLNLQQVNKIVGFDTLQNEETKWYVPEQFWRQKDPRVIKQEAYKKKLTEKYTAKPLKEKQMVLSKCKLKEIIYHGRIPEVKDHYFFVIGRDLHDFLKGYKSKGQVGRANRIQISNNIKNTKLKHEIIYNSPEGYLWDQCIEFIMSEFGLEAIESQTTETVLIAEYDGSQLKDYRDVRCPAIRGTTSTPGMIAFRTSPGVSIRSALDTLARDQEMMIVNNTGIEDKTIITQEVANFKTAKGMELAEKWYKDNFGITFRKEQRQMPVWIIQKK